MTARRAAKETTASNQHLYRSTVEVLQVVRSENHLALEGTYIKVNVQINRPIYRMHKGKIATNVLEVCDTKCDFVFVLADWEGSTEGFLTPYRGQRYHLQECRGAGNALTTAKEYFNMKHSTA
ncbi:retrotransposon protein [Cucumis melo var. makuwa]|uniref:Retrotransposon protein n=1 Tax=Cucumis melo var. makuwa TaxID=1194695 RepID=A0A5A7TP47_CUCMM|nr:retrotransposon protein [Cucumis melo var. makuwa]